ncbi:MAG: hypothetical protein WD827_03855 [Solirubrobacterales bacterium]
MKSNTGRVLLGIALVAAAVVLLILLKGSEEDDGGTNTTATAQPTTEPTKPPKPAIPTIVVKGGEPVGGVEQLSYEAGDQIRFKVTSDTSDEVHIHTYDVSKEIPAGGTVTLSFPADIEGIFEAELHGSGEQIAEIQVNP